MGTAADRAGAMVTEQVLSIIEAAEHNAEEIRSSAERDAEQMRKDAVEAAHRILDRLDAIEGPLGELVAGFRREADSLTAETRRSAINARDENSAASEARRGAPDLTEAADRAGAIVSEQIRAMLEAAENRGREIRRSAEKEARELRQGAASEAGTLFEKLEALEAPLDALVSSLRGELDSRSTEFRRHWANDEVVMHAVPENGDAPAAQLQQPQAAETAQHEQAEPEPEERPSAETVQHKQVQQPAEPEPEPEPAEAEHYEDEPEAEANAASQEQEPEATEYEEQESEAAETAVHAQVAEPAPEEHAGKKRGPLGWLKRRKSALFITTPGQCAVCYHSYAAGSEEALAASGWKVSGELGLCPQCQSEGWQLPEGARLPYRRAAG